MKILYNIAGTYRSGGMERVLANKSNWLVANGYEVVIATTDQCGRPSFFKLDSRIKCYDLNINYEKNNGTSLISKIIHFPYKQFLHKRRLKALIDVESPDLVVSMFCNDVNFITDIQDNSSKILEIHFSKFKRLQYGRKGLWKMVDSYLTKKDERLVRKFDRFVVLSHEDKSYWGEMKNIVVIPNALSRKKSYSCSSLLNKRAIAVGRYTYQKGFDRLIDAWKIVHEYCPDWQLDIVGEGEDKIVLENQIKNNKLENIVHLISPTLEIEHKYLESSLLVMSSRYEGFGLVLIEAHSCGLPTVSFNCKSGPSDIIQNGVNGFLIEDGDIKEMALKIVQLIKDEPLRMKMGERAYRGSIKYSEERIMKQWMDLFDEVSLRK